MGTQPFRKKGTKPLPNFQHISTRHCVRWGPSSPPLKGHSPQFSANVRCGQTAGWTKMSLGMEVGLSPGDFVFDGDPAIPRKMAYHPHPIFGPCLLWPNGWMDQDATWYRGKHRPRRRGVRWGRSFPKKGHSPQFSVHVCCGQMAGWLNTPLGTEVDLGPGHIVLDGTQLSAKGVQQSPSFRPMSIVATVAHLSYC